MRDENKYEGQGLRAPIWTVAGIEILKTVLGGGMGALCGGGNAAAAAAGGMAAVAEIAHKDAKIAQLQAEIATNAKIGEVYALLRARDQEQDKKMAELEKKAAVADVVLAQQTALLGQLTKTVIPASSICPEVMPRYNTWTAPAAGTAPATGA